MLVCFTLPSGEPRRRRGSLFPKLDDTVPSPTRALSQPMTVPPEPGRVVPAPMIVETNHRLPGLSQGRPGSLRPATAEGGLLAGELANHFAESGELALVTDGSNYVAGWTIIALLKGGYRVRASLGSLPLEAKVRTAIAPHIQADHRLSFVAADPLNDGGWEEAVNGVDYVVHIGGPMHGSRRARPVIAAARDGVVRVLTAARKAGVKRVVMASSLHAARPTRHVDDLLYADEAVWTNTRNPALGSHIRARTLAEREAWTFMATSEGSMTLTTVLQGLALGPVLGDDHGSLDIVTRLLRGQVSRLPRMGFSIVDVRDLANIYVRAMVNPKAAGQRFIATGDFLWLDYVMSLLRVSLADRARALPSRKVSWLAMWRFALLDPHLRPMLRELGRRPLYSIDKAHAVLGWRARGSSEAVIACGRSLVRHGLV